MSIKKGPVKDVLISKKMMNDSAVSIWTN